MVHGSLQLYHELFLSLAMTKLVPFDFVFDYLPAGITQKILKELPLRFAR
jgi:hypothetical protein